MGVGRAIGHIAVDRIIPLTLKPGGKSANIIFADADLDVDLAATEAEKAFTLNAGQVCSAGTRLFVQRAVYPAFVAVVKRVAEAIVPGETLGRIIAPQQFGRVQAFFDVAKQDRATLVTGGVPAMVKGQEDGFYLAPTIYADLTNDMRVAREEVFGPVGVIIPLDTEQDAIRIANDGDYGLIGTL